VIIPVLRQLNTREQWMDFCRREVPYCFIESPECLLDFQSTFLKITLLPTNTIVHDAIKYSLGSRTSMEPVWRLIKGCNWQLDNILAGLEEMDFTSNVRDNSLISAHTDLSVRKYFNREHCIVAPSNLGLLPPLSSFPAIWDPLSINQLLSNQQYTDLRDERKALPSQHSRSSLPTPTLNEIRLMLLDPVEQCIGQIHEKRLHIFRGKQAFVSLIPSLSKPKPRLKKQSKF
tara:strand:+ start:12773 stop:13465 length:693 start_codon:yes stop_codon:yes gene_type:complete